MSIQKSKAFVLRRQDLRETSVILTFYTRDFGKIKGVLRGVRGSRLHGADASLEIFSLDTIVFYERKTGDIYTVSQCDLIDYFAPVRTSLEKLSYAAYAVELLDSVTAVSDKNTEAFELLLNILRLLSGEASPRRAARIFEIKLLHLLGLMPSLGVCASCGRDAGPHSRFSVRHGGMICADCFKSDKFAFPVLAGTARFMEHVRASPFEKAANIKVAAPVGRELETVLRKFLDYHIERRLKTVEFIREIER